MLAPSVSKSEISYDNTQNTQTNIFAGLVFPEVPQSFSIIRQQQQPLSSSQAKNHHLLVNDFPEVELQDMRHDRSEVVENVVHAHVPEGPSLTATRHAYRVLLGPSTDHDILPSSEGLYPSIPELVSSSHALSTRTSSVEEYDEDYSEQSSLLPQSSFNTITYPSAPSAVSHAATRNYGDIVIHWLLS